MSCPEELRSLEAFWHLKRGDRALPSRCDFTPQKLRPWLGNIGVITVEHGDGETRFRVVLSGTRLDDYRGHSITGLYIDEVPHNVCGTATHFKACVEQRVPMHVLHDNSPNSAIYTEMGKLLLPLSEDGVIVDRVLVAIYPLRAGNDAAWRIEAA